MTAVDLTGGGAHPQAWRRQDSRVEDSVTADYWIDLVTAAERAGADLVFFGDSSVARGLDAVAIAARVAAATDRIGLVPTVAVTHTEPFHVSKQIASVDFASHGRAGWQVEVSRGAEQAALFGRKHAQDEGSLWSEADDAVEVVTRLWDSWEDDAEIRDVATGRFIDRDKVHYIDFEGEHFSVRGPSITPRSPQGQPPVAVRADSAESTAVAAARADIVRIAETSVEGASDSAGRIRRAVAGAGRNPADVVILLDVETLLSGSAAAELARLDDWAHAPYAPGSVRYVGDPDRLSDLLEDIRAAGLDGVTLRPLALPSGVVGLPGTGAVSAGPPPTLRSRLGLSRPVSRYATLDRIAR